MRLSNSENRKSLDIVRFDSANSSTLLLIFLLKKPVLTVFDVTEIHKKVSNSAFPKKKPPKGGNLEVVRVE